MTYSAVIICSEHEQLLERLGDERGFPRHQSEVALEISLDFSGPSKPEPSGFMPRLLCVKQFFHALVNRTEAYEYPHCLGLIEFGTAAEVKLDLTSYFEGFKSALDKTEAAGDTACFDALQTAAIKLTEFNATRTSKGKTAATLRIICLSDGKDTKSVISAFRTAACLREQNILCDAVMIGEHMSRELLAIAKSTGGYVSFITRVCPPLLMTIYQR